MTPLILNLIFIHYTPSNSSYLHLFSSKKPNLPTDKNFEVKIILNKIKINT